MKPTRWEPDWNSHCAELAVQRFRQATGRDLWAEFGCVPRCWREGADFYRWMGVTNLRDCVTAILGAPVPVRQAMRGDICMVDGALGVCRGEWIECIDQMQPLKRATLAWRVERQG